MSDEYSFEKRLAAASTIPAHLYTDPEALEEEKRKVFGRTWQLVGHTEQVAEPGQYFTTTIADEPLIVARGADATLRAFSNVCRHRAGPVASGAGRCKNFRCGYHGWTYSTEGRLLAAPEFEGVEGEQRGCLPARIPSRGVGRARLRQPRCRGRAARRDLGRHTRVDSRARLVFDATRGAQGLVR